MVECDAVIILCHHSKEVFYYPVKPLNIEVYLFTQPLLLTTLSSLLFILFILDFTLIMSKFL